MNAQLLEGGGAKKSPQGSSRREVYATRQVKLSKRIYMYGITFEVVIFLSGSSDQVLQFQHARTMYTTDPVAKLYLMYLPKFVKWLGEKRLVCK